METPTPFDLNAAIQCWRQSMAASPAFRAENLDEIETHLRDSVRSLEAKGLSVEESYLIASRRLGQPAALDREFRKVNAPYVWRSRALWLWMGAGLFPALLYFVRPIWQTAWTGAVAILIGLVFNRRMRFARSFLRRLVSEHPILVSAGLVCCNEALFFVGNWADRQFFQTYPQGPSEGPVVSDWFMFGMRPVVFQVGPVVESDWFICRVVLSNVLLAAALVFLARRHFQSKAEE